MSPSRSDSALPPARPAAIYLSALLIGFVIMGFEMLASRYLFPFFGGSISTWAAIISTVLGALMAGYFLGGNLADRFPHAGMIGGIVFATAVYMALIPLAAGPVLVFVVETAGVGTAGVLLAALTLNAVPVGLLGLFTPFAVRLLRPDAAHSGRIAGRTYAISTLGNIAGVLATTFVFVPAIGSRAITYVFASILVFAGLLLLASGRRRKTAATATAAVLLLAAPASFVGPEEARAETPRIIADASYPEGPLWQDGSLYYAEMGAQKISVWDGDAVRTFWTGQGCGPTSIAPYGQGFVILCHLGGRLELVDRTGKGIGRLDRGEDGSDIAWPNDSSADGAGGVYLSSSGLFSLEAKAQGRVLYLSPEGAVRMVASGIRYANGVYVDASGVDASGEDASGVDASGVNLGAAGGRLLVSEHLGRRILAYPIEAPGRLGPPTVLADFADLPLSPPAAYPLAGPDGLERDAAGTLLVAEYGEGRIHRLSPAGRLLETLEFPMPYLTNLAFAPDGRMAVTGSLDNLHPPFPGAVVVLPPPR